MTIEQKQHLLAYLGFYTDKVDGKFGKNSKRATRDFQLRCYDLEIDGSCGSKTEKKLRDVVGEIYTMPDLQKIYPALLKCKCGGKGCDGYPVEIDWRLLRYLDRIILESGKSFSISSGVRCKVHNKAVRGSATSCHMKGKAVDFAIIGMSGKATLEMVQKIVNEDLHSAYIIENNWIHMCIK